MSVGEGGADQHTPLECLTFRFSQTIIAKATWHEPGASVNDMILYITGDQS